MLLKLKSETNSSLRYCFIGISPLRLPTELPPLPATLLTLGLWLGRSIIVPICIHRPQSCRLLHDADIYRSYSFSSLKEGWSRSKTIVLAYPSLGSSIPECIRLPVMLHRRYLACFLCKINLLCGFRHRKFIYDVTHDISVRWSKRVHNTCKHPFLITW